MLCRLTVLARGPEEGPGPGWRSPARHRPERRRWAGLAAALTLTAPTLAVAGPASASASANPPTCGLAPVGVIGSVYGAKFRPLAAQTKGRVTVCTFLSTVPVISVLVRFQVGESAADFEAGRREFDRRAEHTVSRPGFGSHAYSVVLGAGKTLTSTIVVLTGSTELMVTGTGTLAKAEALAQKVLPRI